MNVADLVQAVAQAKTAQKTRKVNHTITNHMNKPKHEGFLSKPAVKDVVIPSVCTSLNKTGVAVKTLQNALAFLDYPISKEEFYEQRFGKTTLEALNKFQEIHKIPVSSRFDAESKKIIGEVLHETNSRIVKPLTYRIRGGVRNQSGFALVGYTVKITIFTKGYRSSHTRTTNTKGFYYIPFECPKGSDGRYLSSFLVEVSVYKSENDPAVLFTRLLTVDSPNIWCNFGSVNRSCELERMLLVINNTFEVSEAIDLFVPSDRYAPQTVAKLTAIPVFQIKAISLAAKMYRITTEVMANSRVNLGYNILYAIIRQDIPDGLNEFYNLFKYRETGNRSYQMVTDSQQEAINTGVKSILERIFLMQEETIRKAVSDSVSDKIISGTDQDVDGYMSLLDEARILYILHRLDLKDGVTLEHILSVSSVNSAKYPEIARRYARVQDLGGAFVSAVADILTQAECEDLERSLTILDLLQFNISAAKAVKKDLEDFHLGKMAYWETSFYQSKGIQDAASVLNRIRTAYPEFYFVHHIRQFFSKPDSVKKELAANVPEGSDAFKFIMETVAGAPGPLADAMVIRDEKKRFVFKDMSQTGDYLFAAKQETERNERIKKGVRALQRLFKISPFPAAMENMFLKHGITSATEAYYTGKSFITSARIWSSVEQIYLKTLSRYQEILDATRSSSQSLIRSSANLRRLFGSIDSYYYDDSLSLLSPAAYLTDLLRFLENVSNRNGSNAYNVLVARRPEIPHILLNKKNSETLVPQIDLVCEALEMALTGNGWVNKQTEADGEEALLVPEYTQQSVYQSLDSSGQPAWHPYFNLPAVQVREYMRTLGVERYQLMEFYGRPRFNVAAEYFGMSPQESALFTSSATHTWQLEIKQKGNIHCVPLLHFLNAADIGYQDAVRILDFLGITLSDADPDGAGYPDITRQDILFADNSVTLARLQRFIILLKRTDLTVEELAGYVADQQVCGGEMNQQSLVALMDALIAKRKEEEREMGEDTEQTASLSKDEVRILLEHCLDSFPTLPEKEELCAVVADSYSVDTSLLESVWKEWNLDAESVESAASALLTAAIMNSSLGASLREILFVETRFGRTWSREVLADIVELISFNHDYKLNGEEPLAVDPDMTAADCRHARTVFTWLEKLGLPTESELSALATIGSFAEETTRAEKLLAVLRGRHSRNTAVIRETSDKVRVQKRDALVGHVLARQFANRTDKEGLLDHYLLDVLMGPEQETTRIKMATNSVQLFVQRCLLGLEEKVAPLVDVNTRADNWAQWTWLKNYRVWEASRKIFLFPENWIDPELRDDMTPEFKDFITAIEGDEASSENMETALMNYLYSLDEIARLDVCGIYRQQEGSIDKYHVLARTRDNNSVYYYRSYDNNAEEWTPWEKLDIEIEGDQIVPVVYNRRLYLFWLKFLQKTLKVERLPGSSSTQQDSDAPQPANYHELQLVWSFRKEDSWTPPKTGKMKLIHPWDRPRYSYDMKPHLDKENRLHLDIYLSSSKEFNGVIKYTKFDYYPSFSCRYSSNAFDEKARPWHSSTFVFEGDVTEVLLKDIRPDVKNMEISSYDFVHSHFGEDGAAIKKLEKRQSGPRLITPEGMHLSRNRLVNDKEILNASTLRTLEVNQAFYDAETRSSLVEKLLPSDGRTAQKDLDFKRDALNYSLELTAIRSRTLLSRALSPFELVISQQSLQMSSLFDGNLMFYQDGKRSLCFRTGSFSKETLPVDYTDMNLDDFLSAPTKEKTASVHVTTKTCNYQASLFYHPYVRMFIKSVREGGIDAIYRRGVQTTPWQFDTVARSDGNFFSDYSPSELVTNSPAETVDFSFSGAYGVYNWELFFHIPLTVACRLSENNKFEEAMKWFHFIFNPMAYVKQTDSPETFWITKPFYETAIRKGANTDSADRIESILADITGDDAQLRAWKNNPFSPHLVARYRTSAYQKAVVSKYIANLIAWGDMLFKQDTMESINEATLLYVLAYEILGTRPQKVKSPIKERHDKAYEQLRKGITAFGNQAEKGTDRAALLLDIESLLDFDGTTVTASLSEMTVPRLDVYYFDTPQNDAIEVFWDMVEDRLLKIRASLNIDGIFRKLAINAPEIDPGALVSAAAGGGSLSDAINAVTGADAERPPYRFKAALALAEQMCAEVRAIGEKMLSATEKYDAEDLAMLRASQEKALQKAMIHVREQEIKELEANLVSLEQSLQKAEKAREYYMGLTAISDKETRATKLNEESLRSTQIAVPLNSAGATLSAAGNLLTGAAGLSSPLVGYVVSFEAIGQSLMMQANSLQMTAGLTDRKAAIISTNAIYERRAAEWAFQAEQSAKDVSSLENQIAGAEHRLDIARTNLENQRLQIEQSEAVIELLKSKKSSRELYKWMRNELAAIYKKAYNLAYDLAKKAELCFQWELGIKPGVIQAKAWNSKYDGLLAGDLLMQQIRQLQQKYWESNVRNFELTKHIPLSCLPSTTETGSALLDLVYGQECDIELPEWLFDMDYPDQYFRRIKRISLTIPCVVGPYTNVNCLLSLTGHAIREEKKNGLLDIGNIVADSIATSTAVNDGGQFDVNFNDDRYLPFEGFGAVSRWHLELSDQTNHFDKASISDVILNVLYTAKRDTALQVNHGKPDRKAVMVASLKREFQPAWRELKNGARSLQIQIPEELYPFWMRRGSKEIVSVMGEIPGPMTKKVTPVVGGHVLSADGTLELDFNNFNGTKKLSDVKVVISVSL